MEQQNLFINAVIDGTQEVDTFDKEKVALGIFGEFKSYAKDHDISEELYTTIPKSDSKKDLLTTKPKGGNLEILYRDSVLFRLRCTNVNIGVHVPDRTSSFLVDTKPLSITDLTQGWKCFSYIGSKLDENVLFGLFCILIEELKHSLSSQMGCCSLYQQCSDMKKCIIDVQNPILKDLKLKCTYRLNLLQGKIFYGINALKGLDYSERELLKAYRYADNAKKLQIFDLVHMENEKEREKQIEAIRREGITGNAEMPQPTN